jgi:lipoprotein-releasing system permease protein
MKWKLLADVSRSLLLARWRQTLVAAVGVTFSITMFVTLLSFMAGLNDLLDGLILNRTAHIRLYHEVKPADKQPLQLSPDYSNQYHFIRSVKPKNERKDILNNAAIIDLLKKDSRVEGVAPKITAQVFYNVGTTDLTGVINGIDVAAENSLFFFGDYVTEGNFIDLQHTPNSIILGKGVADQILANLGDMIQVTTAKGERIPLKVVGFFQSGLQDLDKGRVIVRSLPRKSYWESLIATSPICRSNCATSRRHRLWRLNCTNCWVWMHSIFKQPIPSLKPEAQSAPSFPMPSESRC